MAKAAVKKTTKPATKKAAKEPKKPKYQRKTPANEPSLDFIKEMLQLPKGPEGDERLEKMLSTFDDRFTRKERLFILFYTNPNSMVCGKVSKAGEMAGGAWHAYGSWALQQPHVKERVNDIFSSTSLQDLVDIFREDIEFNKQVLFCDRTAFKKDTTVDIPEKDISFDTMDDKKIMELSETQRKMVSGFDYDKNGRPHFAIETRESARKALLTYYKLLVQKGMANEGKETETVVTLEGIRDKATAKIKVIQRNNAEAEAAGEFIEPMSGLDEEA